MTDMLIPTVHQLYAAIERHDTDALDRLYHDEVELIEYPNRLVPNGIRRNKAAILEGSRRGAALLASQTLRAVHAIEQGSMVAVQAHWNARLAIDAPPLGLKAGDGMRAHFAQFLHFREGRIIRHETYDCFEPW